jgi:hypothetical protein
MLSFQALNIRLTWWNLSLYGRGGRLVYFKEFMNSSNLVLFMYFCNRNGTPSNFKPWSPVTANLDSTTSHEKQQTQKPKKLWPWNSKCWTQYIFNFYSTPQTELLSSTIGQIKTEGPNSFSSDPLLGAATAKVPQIYVLHALWCKPSWIPMHHSVHYHYSLQLG